MHDSYINPFTARPALRRGAEFFARMPANCVTPMTASDGIAVTEKGARRHRWRGLYRDDGDAVTAIWELLRVHARALVCACTQNIEKWCHGVTGNGSVVWLSELRRDEVLSYVVTGRHAGCGGADRALIVNAQLAGQDWREAA
jgi:hypothetical protein